MTIRSGRRSLTTALVGLGLVGAAFAVPATAAPAAPAAGTAAAVAADAPDVPDPGPISWGVCDNPTLVASGAQCGTVDVPLDYDEPEGETISLAVSRIQHTSSDADYQGPILFNPGGPGGSGLIYSIFGNPAYGYFPQSITSEYDFIGFDPRGVGSSEPAVSCDPDYAAPVRPRYTPRDGKKGRLDVRAWIKKNKKYTRDCAENNDPALLDNLTTEDNALDMESIRKALEAPQLNYYGFSYGTYLGQVYGTLFPENVRRMVFDGTVDPRDVWYQANLNQDVAFTKTSNAWFRWIANNDDVYGIADTAKEVKDTYFRINDRLARKPAGPAGAKIGEAEWSDTFLTAGYYDSTWPDLAQLFADYVETKDTAPIREAAEGAAGDDNGFAMYLATECTDTSWPQKWSRWKKDNERIAAKNPFLTWGNAWFNESCRHWPGEVSEPVRVDGSGVDSLLMVNEEFDAATPLPGSYEVRKRFENASLILVDKGVSHSNSLAGNECVDQPIYDYLADGALPERKAGKGPDVNCEALPHPPADGGLGKRGDLRERLRAALPRG